MLMFACKLAAAMQPQYRQQLPANLAVVSEQVVTAAALTAAGCLAGLLDAVRELQALAS